MSRVLGWVWAEREWISGVVATIAVPLFAFLYSKARLKQQVGIQPMALTVSTLSPASSALAPAQLTLPVSEKRNGLPALPTFDADKRRGEMYKTQEFPCQAPRPERILEEVNRSPPLQQCEKAMHYVGVRVRWTGQLMSLHWLEYGPIQGLSVTLAASMRSALSMAYIHFTTPDAPGWTLVDLGTIVDVSGTIDHVAGYDIHIREVEINAFR